jgi:hypothetical protein
MGDVRLRRMLDLRPARFLFVVFALVASPRLALAVPPVALGTLEVRGTATVPPPVLVMRSAPTLPTVEPARLPEAARAPYLERQRAVAERSAIEDAMRAHGGSGMTQGPTTRDIVRRERAARTRVRQALERNSGSLEAEGWLVLAELRLEDANDSNSSSDGELSPAALASIRGAYTQAAARGGTRPTGLWARLRESALATRAGDFAAAESALGVVIANSPPGVLRATALVEQADLAGGPQAATLYARALAEGADAPLRAYVRFAMMLASRYSDPTAARDAGGSILSESDDATAELAAPVVGELLVRTGDLAGMSLPQGLAPERAARVLGAAAETALGLGERPWAELALRAAVERAPSTRSGRAAAARLAQLTATPAPAAETVPQWLVRQATRCQSDALSADARTATGEFDVLVRRQRGIARVVARVRPGAGAGAARFKRCIEGTLPDPPALDASAVYQGAIRLR